MDDLPLEGIHRLKLERFATLFDLIGARLREFDQVLALLSPETIDIEHETAPLTGRGLDCQSSQLLKGIKDLSVTTDEMVELATLDDEVRAIVLHRDLDIPVKIGDIKEPLEVVSGNIALFFKLGYERLLFLGLLFS
jgi:hypothetical protein